MSSHHNMNMELSINKRRIRGIGMRENSNSAVDVFNFYFASCSSQICHLTRLDDDVENGEVVDNMLMRFVSHSKSSSLYLLYYLYTICPLVLPLVADMSRLAVTVISVRAADRIIHRQILLADIIAAIGPQSIYTWR